MKNLYIVGTEDSTKKTEDRHYIWDIRTYNGEQAEKEEPEPGAKAIKLHYYWGKYYCRTPTNRWQRIALSKRWAKGGRRRTTNQNKRATVQQHTKKSVTNTPNY